MKNLAAVVLALVVSVDSCGGGGGSPDARIDPHQFGPCNDPSWTMYGHPFCQAACFGIPAFDVIYPGPGCRPAFDPASMTTSQCDGGTLTFGGVMGCCVAHLTMPGNVDEVRFYECR